MLSWAKSMIFVFAELIQGPSDRQIYLRPLNSLREGWFFFLAFFPSRKCGYPDLTMDILCL